MLLLKSNFCSDDKKGGHLVKGQKLLKYEARFFFCLDSMGDNRHLSFKVGFSHHGNNFSFPG